jgi:hypothetical protein
MEHGSRVSEQQNAAPWPNLISGLRAICGLGANAPFRSAVAWGMGIALVAMVLLFGANKFVLYSNLSDARARVTEAFAQGDLTDADYAHGDTIIGGHQFNDCLILGMALDQPGGVRQELSISPIIPGIPKGEGTGNFEHPCVALHGLTRSGRDVSDAYYHRYIHGQVVLTRYLLPSLGVDGMRIVYKSLLSVLLLVGFSVALLRLTTTRSAVYVGYAITFACFARLFGLGEFGQSLGHAPSDMLILIYLLFACLSAEKGWTTAPMMAAAAAFGALTMIFELLTGGLPLGAAVIIGTAAMTCARTARPQQLVGTTLGSLVAFLTAAVTCAAIKLAASVAVFGPAVLSDYGHQLEVRMALTKADDHPVSAVLFFGKLVGGLSSLAEYSRVLAGGTILIAAVAGIWGLRAVLRSRVLPAQQTRAILLALSTVPILLWFPLFWQHTIQHAWFMDRILVWIIAAGFWLFSEGLAATATDSNKGLFR